MKGKPQQKDCKLCSLCKERTQVVVSDGGIRRCNFVFVGEGPGEEEDQEGRAFIGTTGKFLRKHVKKNTGLVLGKDAIVLNSVSCRPPGNRDPKPDEVLTCRSWLQLNLSIIQPRFIVAVGRFSAWTFIDEKIDRIGKGYFYNKHHFRDEWKLDRFKFKVIQIWHPGYVWRNRTEGTLIAWRRQMIAFADMAKEMGYM